MVRNEDERAQALRDMGAEVVVGDLLDLDLMHRVIAGCATMYFGMSVSDADLAATVNAAAVAKDHGVKAFINMSQMTLAQMSITETTASPQQKLHWLAEQAHIGRIYHLTGPQSDNMEFSAQEYAEALGRTITFQDIPLEPWRNARLKRGLPVHLVNHLATMADLHRAGRDDRMSDDVLTLTGQVPLSLQEFVRKQAATFTASAQAAML